MNNKSIEQIYAELIKDNKDYGFADTQYENIIIEFENNLK